MKITYLVKNYANKENFDIRLKKCETFSFLGDHCDPTFHFNGYTINERGERIVTVKKQVGPFPNTRFIKSVLEAEQIQKVFPKTIEFDLDIYDSDADSDQQIARFQQKLPITKIGEIELRLGVDVRVEVIIRIECAKDYYGEHCETYCQPYSGLWTCHEVTGARVCAKPCIHGSCILTNQSAVCICTSGWSGEFCKLAADSSLISSIILPEIPPALVPGADEQESHSSKSTDESNEQYAPQILKPKERTTVTTAIEHNAMDEVALEIEFEQTSRLNGSRTTATLVSLPDKTSETHQQSAEEETEVPVILNNRNATNIKSSATLESNETANFLEVQDSRWGNNTTVIRHVVGGFQSESSSTQMIALITVGVITVWVVIFLIIALLIYRRRMRNKGLNHSGSLWTNASYDLSHVSVPHTGRLYLLPDGKIFENTNGQPDSGGFSSNISRNPSMPRNSPSKVSSVISDGSDSIRYKSPPIQGEGRIRFAARKADPLPPAPKDIPCMTLTDPYDELMCLGEDYAVWKPDPDGTSPLTSLR